MNRYIHSVTNKNNFKKTGLSLDQYGCLVTFLSLEKDNTFYEVTQ